LRHFRLTFLQAFNIILCLLAILRVEILNICYLQYTLSQ